jgi:hypothetical protein
MKLIDTYKINKGLQPLFDDTIILDWYDGVTTGISRLRASNEWYLSSLYYFDPVKDYRVFSLLEISKDWARKLKNKLVKPEMAEYDEIKKDIKSYYRNNSDRIYFAKAMFLEDNDYEIVKPDETGLKYFENIDEVMNHSAESLLVVRKYFVD